MTQRLVQVGDVTLCVETFGSPSDPTVLLIHGACASMLWWPRAFCTALAARGRHVVRYDSRDTGRSTHHPPGRPPYSLATWPTTPSGCWTRWRSRTRTWSGARWAAGSP